MQEGNQTPIRHLLYQISFLAPGPYNATVSITRSNMLSLVHLRTLLWDDQKCRHMLVFQMLLTIVAGIRFVGGEQCLGGRAEDTKTCMYDLRQSN